MIFKEIIQGTNCYLEYNLKNEEVIDEIVLGMLINNKIEGILPIVYSDLNNEKILNYNIVSKVSLEKYLENEITREKLLSVLHSFSHILLIADDYMINTYNFVLDFNFVFVNTETNSVELICLPIEHKKKDNINLRLFFTNILLKPRFNQSENLDYIPILLNYLNSSNSFSIKEFNALLKKLSSNQPLNNNSQINKVPNNRVQNNISQQTTSSKPQSNINSIKQRSNAINNVVDNNKKLNEKVKPKNEPATNTNYAIPNKSIHINNVSKNTNVSVDNSNEKPITFMNLLLHYNKENREKYNNQKKNHSTINPQSNNMFNKPPTASENVGFKVPNSEKSNISIPSSKPSYNSKDNSVQPSISNVESNINKETQVCNEDFTDEGTTLLNEEMSLENISNGVKYSIQNDVTLIGKSLNNVNIHINNNTISRIHAKISKYNDRYFVCDLNSTNNTYVNGVKINSNEDVEIVIGDSIKFSNEEFKLC